MLIGVSSFFRDADAFEDLRVTAIEPLVKALQDDTPLRAWVPGCATGEEAYSVAMLLLEARSAAGKSCPVQVFATDVDEKALETARAGAYPLGIADDVPPHLLEAYFVRQVQTYQVEKHLREAVVFSRHNLLTDPPFSKLDLISCRNVLIYIESPAQKKVLSVFSFALNVGGYLLLGKSEGVAGMEDLFEPVSKKDRLYRLTRSNRRAAGEFPLYAAGRFASKADRDQAVCNASVLQQANLEGILRHFDASVVLVDPEGKILYFSGRTEKYLGHPKGPASLNILDMTGGTLSAKLRRAMEQVLQQEEPIDLTQVPLPREGSPLANLTVMRVADRAGGGRLLAVIFEDAQSIATPGGRPDRRDRGRAAGGPTGGGGQGSPRRTADQRRGVRLGHRGTQGRQRRSDVHERGTPVGQRGTGGLQGGIAVGQRGVDHGQQPTQRQAGRVDRGKQRSGQPADGHGYRHDLSGCPIADQAIHAAGDGTC